MTDDNDPLSIPASELPIDFVIRVKLPNPNGYASCPSGDTDYDNDYRDAIFAAKPVGLEVKWPRVGQTWPVDSEGFTFVPLYVTSHQDRLLKLQQQFNRLLTIKASLIEKARDIANLTESI